MTPLPRLRRIIYLTGALIVAGLGIGTLLLTMPAVASQTESELTAPAWPDDPSGSISVSEEITATVWLDGPTGEISVDEEITVTMRISYVVDLYGLQVTLVFSPADLQVIDADLGTEGVQIESADCPQPDFIESNVVSNTAGTIRYVVTHVFPTLPFSGDCDVAHIRFKTQQAAQTSVSFADLILSDDDTNALPYTALDLDLEVTGAGNVYLPIVIKS